MLRTARSEWLRVTVRAVAVCILIAASLVSAFALLAGVLGYPPPGIR